jgi:DNA-binding Xre family transcriptional regulator
MKVALRLDEMAAAHGLDAQSLAAQAGVTPDVAQGLLAGEAVEIELSTLGRLSELLGVLPNELVAEVEEPQQSVADGAEPPRSIDVPKQGMDEIKKEPTDQYDPETPAERLSDEA